MFVLLKNYWKLGLNRTRAHKLQKQCINIFRHCISNSCVLESIEKLPVYMYDSPGGGLQTLTKRLRFRVERTSSEATLYDRTLKMEPLATVGQTNKKMVAKQCYDKDRGNFYFLNMLKENPDLCLKHHQLPQQGQQKGLVHRRFEPLHDPDHLRGYGRSELRN